MSEEAAELAARQARRWASLAMLVACVFVAVTIIDNQIKRDVIRHVVEARRILDEYRGVVADGTRQSAAAGGADRDVDDDLVHDPGASAPPAGDEGGAQRAAGRGAGGAAGGAPGDG